jgi:hypothetical protein
MQVMLAVVTAAALIGGGAMALDAASNAPPVVEASYLTDQAQLTPQRIVIGIDLSRSNPLIDEPQFASRVGARVATIIRGLGFASEVHVRTFGSYDATSNNFHYDTVISVRNRPDDVADQVEKLIAGTPMLIERGKWKAQDRTNILAFLDNVSQSIGCSGLPTTVILATDGIEDSVYARLDDPDDHLPAPEGRPFAGCAGLQILGIGEGTRSPIKTTRLRDEWTRWAHEAGFAKFQGLNDW